MSLLNDGFQKLRVEVEEVSDNLYNTIDNIPVIGWFVRVINLLSSFIVLLNMIPVIGPIIGNIMGIAFLGPLLIFEPVMSLLGLLVIPFKILSTGQAVPPPQFIPGGTSVVWLLYIEKAIEMKLLWPIIPIPWIWFAWILLGLCWVFYLPFIWGFWLISKLFHKSNN